MKHFYSFTFMFRYEKKIKNPCAHCYWSKKFEMSRAEGRSLLAGVATNLFQVVAA